MADTPPPGRRRALRLLTIAALLGGPLSAFGSAYAEPGPDPGPEPDPEAADATRIRADPPPGFEELEGEAFVDVFWGGVFRGRTTMQLHNGSLTLLEPKAVVDMIPNIVGRDQVLAALSGRINANKQRACSFAERQGCNQLDPEVAGVIYEQALLRLRVFIAPVHLSTAGGATAEEFYLPSPETGLTWVPLLGAILNTREGNDPTLAFQGRSILAFDRTRLRTRVRGGTDTEVVLDEMVGQLDLLGPRFEGGLFDVSYRTFGTSDRMIGARFSTPADLVRLREQSFTSPVYFSLPRPATVSVMRDGQVLAVRFYDAGNHILDADLLPQGAYSITLRIEEEFGGARYEEHFVVKSQVLPPAGRPLYLIEAGVAETDLERLLARIGTAHRVGTSFGFGANVSWEGDLGVADTTLTLVTEYLRASVSGFVSHELDWGVAAQVDGPLGALYYALTARHIARVDGADISNRSVPRTSGTDLTALVGVQFGPFNVRANGGWTKPPNGAKEIARADLGVDWLILSLPWMQASLRVDGGWRSDTGVTASGFLFAQFSLPHVAFAGRAGSIYQDETVSSQAEAQLLLRDHDLLDDDLELDLTYRHGDAPDSLQADLRYRGALGQLYMQGKTRLEGPANNRLRSILLVNGAVDDSGAIFGGSETQEAALIVRVDGASDDKFEVLIGEGATGQRQRWLRDTVTVGQRKLIMLRPYRQYEIRLQPLSQHLVDIDLKPRFVTLFPGSVETVVFASKRIIPVFGRALRSNGEPIGDALIEGGVWPGATDADGYFQLEVGDAALLTITPKKGLPCRIFLPRLDVSQQYARLGELICR